MLRSLTLKSVYKSDEDNILEDFYFPTLSVAKSYDRAVGFFSASTISYAAQALTVFIQNGGTIRLILGAFADNRDIEAVNEGLRLREVSEGVASQFLSIVGEINNELFQKRFEALSWLVAHKRLDIKVALRPKGMYHDKVGIIRDAADDALVFSGSANESAHALLPTHNYESIDVYPGWKPELAGYFGPHEASFERLWKNESRNTAVIDLPQAIEEKLLSVATTLHEPPSAEREAAIVALLCDRDERRRQVYLAPKLPESINGMPFNVREHQRTALNEWRSKGDFQGILDLATGAGKTITAIYAIVQMAKQIPGLTVVIAAPYQNLADQWCENLEQFNIRALQCYVSKGLWLEELQHVIHDIEMGVRPFAALVVVNRTLKSAEFQTALHRIPGDRLFWIGDECHHHSSESFEGFLPTTARYRLGLSATPKHYLDDDRNARLVGYYGDVVYTYSLAQAIQDKVLTPYNYFPHIVTLTAEESDEFIRLSDEIGRQFGRTPDSPPSRANPILAALLMRRARLIASAARKLPALERVLADRSPEAHSLFYCGDGWVEPQDGEDAPDAGEEANLSGRQVEVVSQKLDSLGWRLSRFTARESRRERETILRNFRIGLIDGLVAIRCLDEGIDVPACGTAYILASSRDPRQFIQRRGRILRKSPGKDIANIHDFVVVLPEGAADESGHARKLIKSELQRVAEFSGLAVNKYSAYEVLRPILTAYGLEHVV